VNEAQAKAGIVSKQAFILGENEGFNQKMGGISWLIFD